MSLLRAVLRFFSDLTEATSATASDWLAIQKSGESELKKIKPTNLPYLASSHAASSITGFGTTAADLGTSAAGSATTVSRSDHVHKMPSAADVGAAATAHPHGSLTSDGKLGTTADLPVKTTSGGAIAAGAWGSTAGTFCQGNDARLSDARTPTTHTHGSYDNSTALTGANVYSQVTVEDGIVTGLSSRALTPSNIGAANLAGSGSQDFTVRNLATTGFSWIANAAYSTSGILPWDGLNFHRGDMIAISEDGSQSIGYNGRPWGSVYCGAIQSKAVVPETSDTYDLGSSAKLWDDVYATNGTIQTSDKRAKTDTEASDLGLDFVLRLRPVRYRWASRKRTRPIRDQEGRVQLTEMDPAIGVRSHYGLIAQEVVSALNGADFGGLVYDPEADRYGLRYSEFIAPLIAAVQELSARVEALESARLAPGQQSHH